MAPFLPAPSGIMGRASLPALPLFVALSSSSSDSVDESESDPDDASESLLLDRPSSSSCAMLIVLTCQKLLGALEDNGRQYGLPVI